MVPALLSSERLTMQVLGLFLLSCVWSGRMGLSPHTQGCWGHTDGDSLGGHSAEAETQASRSGLLWSQGEAVQRTCPL